MSIRKISGSLSIILVATASFSLIFSQSSYAKDKWEEGTATIGNNKDQKNCPVGASATAREQGCGHSVCTTAKNKAKANLLAQYPSCGPYIHATSPCLKGPGCRD
ncbi:hypothetical protein TAO_0426 [Candidatus Nitrosoglobus terrae]|uniref:Secreted protein n=1 Tax=Candidatus Nitrosoglobus terrae TaxID=1630141 RepID=A0A1Q2SKX4_9GAMM|nr:hypothetical protein [Candidatus Nitrosoglobus terrae]BAW79796.1 hypothetical protein TAO_0426 [Candidatus Nitrosoglobus terrae]